MDRSWVLLVWRSSRLTIFQVQLCIFRYTVQCTLRQLTGKTLVERASLGKIHGRHYFSPQQNGAKNHWIPWQCTFKWNRLRNFHLLMKTSFLWARQCSLKTTGDNGQRHAEEFWTVGTLRGGAISILKCKVEGKGERRKWEVNLWQKWNKNRQITPALLRFFRLIIIFCPPQISMNALMEAIIVTHMVCVRTTMDHSGVGAKADFLEVASLEPVRVGHRINKSIRMVLCFEILCVE